ncbi:Ribosomal protein L29 [Methylacidiphilum infernorum V4]|uniref:Ribosomal protein L29 n=1 Tax=Methylacidiphilum infernorum (isolate V4) TaxID=481448 RepID=B3E0J2_METI4|nr:Ribosomal protein L29 [Methylacidiphilum infernorum V4]
MVKTRFNIRRFFHALLLFYLESSPLVFSRDRVCILAIIFFNSLIREGFSRAAVDFCIRRRNNSSRHSFSFAESSLIPRARSSTS